MNNSKGGSSCLASYGYFVSTSSDDEDTLDYGCESYGCSNWRGGKGSCTPQCRYGFHDDLHFQKRAGERHSWDPIAHQSGYHRSLNVCYSPLQSTEAQLYKSRECREASEKSLKQSLELMAKGVYSDSEEVDKYQRAVTKKNCKGSLQASAMKILKGSGAKLQRYYMEPTRDVIDCTLDAESVNQDYHRKQAKVNDLREVFEASKNWQYSVDEENDNVGSSCEVYPDPIDLELYYNHFQSTSTHDTGGLRIGSLDKCNTELMDTSDCVRSNLVIFDWECGIEPADMDPFDHLPAIIRPQRVCKTSEMDATVHLPMTKGARLPAHKQKPSQQFRPLKRSQDHDIQAPRKQVIDRQVSKLRNLNRVKQGSTISQKNLQRRAELDQDMPKDSFNQNDVQETCQQKSRLQHNVRLKPPKEQKTGPSSHQRLGHPKCQLQKNHLERGGTKIIRCQRSLLASPKSIEYIEEIRKPACLQRFNSSLHEQCYPELAIEEDRSHTNYWKSYSRLRRQESYRPHHIDESIVEIGAIDENSDTWSQTLRPYIVDHVMTPEQENAVVAEKARLKCFTMQRKGEKPHYVSELGREELQNNTKLNASEIVATGLGEEYPSNLETKSSNLDCLRERQLQTLNIIEYKTQEKDKVVVYQNLHPKENINKVGLDAACEMKAIANQFLLKSKVMPSQIYQGRVNVCKKGDGKPCNSLPKKGSGRINNSSAPSGLTQNEDDERKKSATPRSLMEVQRAQASSDVPTHLTECNNINLQEEGKEPELVQVNNFTDLMRVDVEGDRTLFEIVLQSNRLLKLLQELKVRCPPPDEWHGITSAEAQRIVDRGPRVDTWHNM